MTLNTRAQFQDINCLVKLAWAIVGLLLEKSVHSSNWGIHRTGRIKAARKQRQFVRWWKNTKIEHSIIYPNLVKIVFAGWRGHKLYLALDSSSLWDEFVIVRVALNYRGRALPLSWIVLKLQRNMVAFENFKPILKDAVAILIKGCAVILLADRGFIDNVLICAARDLGWGFRIRLKKSLRIYRVSKPCLNVGCLIPAKGKAMFLHKVWITGRQFGSVHLALAHVQRRNGFEVWAILSYAPTDLPTFDEYGLRFDLEENFVDDKCIGFKLESGEIRDAGALTRLGLILATATIYLIRTGTAILALGFCQAVATHGQRGLGYFQIGWRWLHYALFISMNLVIQRT